MTACLRRQSTGPGHTVDSMNVIGKLLVRAAVGVTAACGSSPTGHDANPDVTEPSSPPASLTGPARSVVVPGGAQVCLLRPGGAVSCWGQGHGAGGSSSAEIVAPHVLASPPFVAMASGSRHVCALTAGGTAYCWGGNASGELGDSSRVARAVPTRVHGGLHFTMLMGIGTSTCGRATDGLLYCWGANDYGIFATGSRANDEVSLTPRVVPAASDLTRITGYGRACGVTVSGRPFCWGSPSGPHIIGASNLAATRASTACGATYYVYDDCLVPTPVSAASFVVTEVASGGSHDCALDANGTAYCWGDNYNGAVGGTEPSYRVPIAVIRQPEPWRTIVAGSAITCALNDAGRAWCWGNNFLGYLGMGIEGPPTHVPQQVAGNHQFRQLTAGGLIACGIDMADELWCWGNNFTGLLALPVAQQFSATPVHVSVP